MNKRLSKAYSRFREHFGYRANFPNELDFDQDKYAELLDKCVAENFDYTIEFYGTDPNYGTQPFDGIYLD